MYHPHVICVARPKIGFYMSVNRHLRQGRRPIQSFELQVKSQNSTQTKCQLALSTQHTRLQSKLVVDEQSVKQYFESESEAGHSAFDKT